MKQPLQEDQKVAVQKKKIEIVVLVKPLNSF